MHTGSARKISKPPSETYYFRHSWFHLARPLTLTGTLTPVLAGTVFAATKGSIRLDLFVAILISAIFIQATTNMLNDYFDFKGGQDAEKWTMVAANPSSHRPSYHQIPYVAGALLAVAILAGSWLTFASTYWVIVVGIVGMIAGFAYSAGPRSFSSLGMGEWVAALFLGPVITVLAFIVQGHSLTGSILSVSLPFACLIAAMVLTNNIRDIKKDRPFRKTLAHSLGFNKAVKLLSSLLATPYVITILLSLCHVVPKSAIIVIIALPLAIRLLWLMRRKATRSDHLKGMKWAAWHHGAYGLLFTLGLWIGN